MTKKAPTTTTEDDITNDRLRRFEGTPDPRLRQIMLSLTRHLHAFVKEVQLTEAEWFEGINFPTATGHTCDSARQQFVLLSDTLGISMVVDLINHRKPAGATESTVFGPFHRPGAPELPMGATIAPPDAEGTPATISGRVLDISGNPIEGAVLDVWQTNAGQVPDGQDGRYVIGTIRPVHYPIPTDGSVGRMLAATNRDPNRPAHTHFEVSATGYDPVTSRLFDSIDPYLRSDAVFGVKESLIVEFTERDGKASAEFDFVLNLREGASRPNGLSDGNFRDSSDCESFRER